MNVKHIRLLADLLDERRPIKGPKGALGFNMTTTFGVTDASCQDRLGRGCRTVGCIATWAAVKAGHKITGMGVEEMHDAGAAWLAIDKPMACDLFWPTVVMPFDAAEQISAEDAAVVLRHLADTGTVNWCLIQRPGAESGYRPACKAE